MLDQSRRLCVYQIGGKKQQAICPRMLRSAGKLNGSAGAISATGDHRDAPCGLCHCGRDNRGVFIESQREIFAGSAGGEHRGGMVFEKPSYMAAIRALYELAIVVEMSHRKGKESLANSLRRLLR